MHHYLALAGLLILTSATSGLAYGQANGCHGVESNAPQSYIHQFITEEWDRLEAAVPDSETFDPPPADSLRVMTNEQDSGACDAIAQPLEGENHRRYFYTAGDYYFQLDYPKIDPDEILVLSEVFMVYHESEQGEVDMIFGMF